MSIADIVGSLAPSLTKGLPGGSNSGSTASSMPGGTYNVLNDYRSYTYNFTLACLDKNALKNPDSYKKSTQNFLILRSGGKGNDLFKATPPSPAANNPTITAVDTQGVTNPGGIGNMNSAALSPNGANAATAIPSGDTATPPAPAAPEPPPINIAELVAGFNKESPGRFDMFIDNLEMDCVIAPGKQQGSSTATSVKFDVIEPYSINGFLESLYVAAVSAGYKSYVGAPYLLKIDFVGYPDRDQMGAPEIVPNSSRYFVIRFTSVEMTVTEQGTKYICQATPQPEMAFSEPNKIKTDLKITGATVSEALGDFFEKLNQTLADRTKDEKSEGKAGANNHDIYEIYFPPEPTDNQKPDISKYQASSKKPVDTLIGKAKLPDHLTNNSIISMAPIEEKQNTSASSSSDSNTKKATPQNSQNKSYVPTSQVMQISQGAQINEVIEALIRDSEYFSNILKDVDAAADSAGCIPYWHVASPNIIPLDANDKVTGEPLKKYQYVVTIQRIHKSKLPLQAGKPYSTNEIVKKYVKRTYNYMYTGLNTDVLTFNLKFNNLFYQAVPPKAGNADNVEVASAGANNKGVTTTLPDNVSGTQGVKQQTGSVPVVVSNDSVSKSGKALPPRTDPYFQFAYNAHKSILENSTDQCTAEIEIIGDPYYMVMGGLGVNLPTTATPGLTTEGTADHQNSLCYVKLNFRSPTDIDKTTGSMIFQDELLPFSGVFQVTTVSSKFVDGKFTQRLNLVRMPGQIVDQKVTPEPATKLVTKPKPGQQPAKDVAPADVDKSGVRPSSFDVSKVLGSSALGAITGGALGAITGRLTGISALGAGALGAAAGALIGNGSIPIPSLPTIPNLSNAAKAIGASNIVDPIDVAGSIAAGATNQATNLANSVIGSDFASAAQAGIAAANNLASSVGSSAVSALGSVANPSSLLNGIGSKVAGLTAGLPNDPSAIAASLGIDPSKLSGLSPQLQSQLTSQLSAIAKEVPTDVNLDTLKQAGVSLGNLSKDSLQNIPATAQKLLASIPHVPPDVNPNGVLTAVAAKAKESLSNLPSMSSLAGGLGIPNSIGSLPGALSANITGLAGKLTSAQGLTNSLTGSLPSVEGALGQISNLAGGNPLSGLSSGAISNLQNSVVAKFGSVSAGAVTNALNSPLSNLMNGS